MRATATLPDWVQGLRHTADGLFVVNSHRKIVLWNRGAEHLLGYAESEALGRTCCDLIHGETPAGERWCGEDCAVQRALAERTPRESFDLRIRDRFGARRDANLSIILMPIPHDLLAVHVVRVVERSARDDTVLDDIRALLAAAGYSPSSGGRGNGGNGDARGSDAMRSALTRRELQILSMVAEGMRPPVIADTLCISRYTVRNHLQSILDKLGVHTRSEAVAVAYKNGLV